MSALDHSRHAPTERPVLPLAVHTLADLLPGETARVRTVPEAMRDLLEDLGVREGEDVRCESTSEFVVLSTPQGRVPLDRGVGATVTVSPPPAATGRR